MKTDNSISKSDFQTQIEKLNNETELIRSSFINASNTFKKKECRYQDLQKILDTYRHSILTLKDMSLCTDIWIEFPISCYLDIYKNSKYFKMIQEDKEKNTDIVCKEIEKYMKDYVTSLIEELNSLLNVKIYIKGTVSLAYCYIKENEGYLSLPYFKVNLDIQ